MTEAEWESCSSPEPMLEWLRGKGSDRKFRLFAFACCRRLSDLLDGWSQNLLEAVEQHVDGPTFTSIAVTFATELHLDVIERVKQHSGAHIVVGMVNQIRRGAAWPLAWKTVSAVRLAIANSPGQVEAQEEANAQAIILRDILGNPFRPQPTLNTHWLASNSDTVVKVALTIYDERAFDRLPILADALEEAGFKNEEILDHCRTPGVHVRGCWVLDLILGKE